MAIHHYNHLLPRAIIFRLLGSGLVTTVLLHLFVHPCGAIPRSAAPSLVALSYARKKIITCEENSQRGKRSEHDSTKSYIFHRKGGSAGSHDEEEGPSADDVQRGAPR